MTRLADAERGPNSVNRSKSATGFVLLVKVHDAASGQFERGRLAEILNVDDDSGLRAERC